MKYQFAPLFIPACKTLMDPFDADIQSQVELPLELVSFLLTTSGDAFFVFSTRHSMRLLLGPVDANC
jgi:hypothetical protein